MSEDQAVFVPAYPYDEDSELGLFSRFEPSTRTLSTGFQVEPRFLPLPVDIVLEKDIAVTLRDGVTIYVDVFRPTGAEKVPVIVAWNPYGKSQGAAARYMDIFELLSMETSMVSGLMKLKVPTRRSGAPMAMRSAIPTRAAHITPRGRYASGAVRRARTATTSLSGLVSRTGAMARWGLAEIPTWQSRNGSSQPSNRCISRPLLHGKA